MQEATKQQIKGNWEQMKGRLKETWGNLTDNDLKRVEGQYDQLVGMIREKTGESMESIERKLDNMTKRNERRH